MSLTNTPTVDSPTLRVVLIEDDPVYRHFVRQVLKKVDNAKLIAECSTGTEGIEICRRERPDVLLLDLVLPDQQGVDVVKTIRPELPDIVVMMITAHSHSDLPRELLKLGVQGFADKTSSSSELSKSIRSVLAGGISYNSIAGIARLPLEPIISLPGNTENIKPEKLTVREREIATMVAAAMSSKEVAGKLGLSTRTVEKHRANIYAKLGVRDVVGLTRWCIYHRMAL
ncbi:DNA-binding response regulator [bacterium]|jgi:DNA-binding NarL/FixJ family response regulator|nr:DNA-binding response regulator [bacterium]